MKTAIVAATAATVLAAVHAQPFGGLKPVPLNAHHQEILTKALANDNAYVGTQRLCYLEALSVQEQVVAGTNYYFKLQACPVPSAANGGGKCASANKDCKAYDVTLFEQPWTKTLLVTKVAPSTAARALRQE